MTDPVDRARLAALIREIESLVDPREGGTAAGMSAGLPEDLFLFAGRITPLVNVDLLIQDEHKRTLLTWRSDRFYGPGWHFPGGIIRHRETAAERIREVARIELTSEVDFDPAPIHLGESIRAEWRDRAHHISLLYRCRLTAPLDPMRHYEAQAPRPDQWQWHEGCPQNLIAEQRAYAVYMG